MASFHSLFSTQRMHLLQTYLFDAVRGKCLPVHLPMGFDHIFVASGGFSVYISHAT
jgi:hypothetical protein